MAEKGKLSKTAKASLGLKGEELEHFTTHTCSKCNEKIRVKDLYPVKVAGRGMSFYHKDCFKL